MDRLHVGSLSHIPVTPATRTSSLPLSHGMPGRCNAKKGQLDPKGFHKIPSARPDTVIGRSGLRVYRLVLEAPSRNGKPCGIPGFPHRVMWGAMGVSTTRFPQGSSFFLRKMTYDWKPLGIVFGILVEFLFGPHSPRNLR